MSSMIENKTDSELIDLLTEPKDMYKEDFVANVRLELYSRGYINHEEAWFKDESSMKISSLEEKIRGLERRVESIESFPGIFPERFFPRAFLIWWHVVVAHVIIIGIPAIVIFFLKR